LKNIFILMDGLIVKIQKTNLRTTLTGAEDTFTLEGLDETCPIDVLLIPKPFIPMRAPCHAHASHVT
jgi:hypothetical protein